MTLALAWCAALPFPWMMMAGCRSAPQAKAPAEARLSLDLVLEDPRSRPLLFIDERLVPLAPRPTDAGAAGQPITLRVTHGAHRVEARAPGHFPAYADVDIPADRSLRLRLRVDPDAPPDVVPPDIVPPDADARRGPALP